MSFSPYKVARKHTRYSLDVRAKLIGSDSEITVRMLDISEGGVGLISPVEIPEHGSYFVEFVLPTMQDKFRAQVEQKSRNGFRYGFMFVDIDEGSVNQLKRYQRRWGVHAEEKYADRIV